ncbi:MAG: elongation factor P [Clostridia bacterium]|nr:elongation factor P [Clostridia bacterium]
MEAKSLRPGKLFKMDGVVYEVIDYEFRQQPRLAAAISAKIRNIKTGAISVENFKGNPVLEDVEVEKKELQYSYIDGEIVHFMDMETYEDIPVNRDLCEASLKYNDENGEPIVCTFNYIDGKIASIVPPTFVVLTVAETEPSVAGDTARNALKTAKLSSGIETKVPMFVNNGDKIRVDTRTGAYVDRA